MRRMRTLFFIALTVALAVLCSLNIFSADSFMRCDLYTVSEHEDMSDLGLSILEKTSAFGWTLEDGSSPKQKYEKGLPAYLLLGSSDSCIAEYFSSPVSPIDAYDFKEISFAIRVTAGEYDTFSQNCKFILTLRSGEKSLECTGDIKSGIWNIITFDISAWKHRKSISEMTVSLVGSDSSLPLRLTELSGPYVKKSEREGMDRFMSEGLYALGTELEIIDRGQESEALRLYLNAQRVSISGVASPPYTEEDCNAVRIVISNESELRSLSFNFNRLDPETGRYLSLTRAVAISPSSKMASYIIDTGEVSYISDFSIILDSASAGELTIHKIEPVAIYEGYTGNTYGSVGECKVDAAEKSIVLSGSIFHNYLIEHDDHMLVCYMLRTGETFDKAVSEGRKPNATVKMSSRFSFEMKLSSLGEFALISKYAVASLSPEGKYTLLMAPVCAEGDFGVGETALGRTNIKGFEYENISAAVDCGVGTSVIDVYLDRLVSSKHGGHLYTIDNTFIYFDATYVSFLDKQIKNLHAAGCKVYLRLLISAEADRALLPYAAVCDSSEAKYLSVDISDSNAEKHFYGAVDFLAGRYSGKSNGKISGMILGKSLDRADIYNYSDKNGTVEYARSVAVAFEIMARCAVSSVENIEVLLPVSDVRNGDYDSELLLMSVCRFLDEGGGLELSVVLEGTHYPYEVNGEGGRSFASELSDYYCADNLYVFESMLEGLSGVSGTAPASYLYLWSPGEGMETEALFASYVFGYYSVMFSPKASAFVLSIGSESFGSAVMNVLGDVLKYIDTERNSTGKLCLSALEFFGADSWGDIISGYDEELISYRVFHETASPDNLPNGLIGRYELWDFSVAFGSQDWFEGNNCDSVYVDATAKGGKALCAVVSPKAGTGEYSDMVYNYEYPDDISLMPYLEFNVYIDDIDKYALYEVSVILGGNGHRLETVKPVYGGEDASIIVSTADHGEMEQIDYIRVCVRPYNGDSEWDYKLYLRGVSAYSFDMTDNELEASITKARALARNQSVSASGTLEAEPKHEFIVAMAVIIVLGVAMVGFYDRKQK